MKNTNMKVRWKYIEDRGKRYIAKEKKRLIGFGCIVLAIITLIGGIIVIFQYKTKNPTINGKPATPIEYTTEKNNDDEKRIFLERVESMKSGIYSTSVLVFGEENMRLDETVGESSKNFVTVQADFRVKYSIDLRRMDVSYDFNSEEVILKVPIDSISVDSVEIISDIKETEKYKSFGHKIIDCIPFMNDDEELKEIAIRQLLNNSKTVAAQYDDIELQKDAAKELSTLVDKLNFSDLNYKVEFVKTKSIGIK